MRRCGFKKDIWLHGMVLPGCSSSTPTSPTGSSRSILYQLRPPTASDIMRKRKVRVKKAPHSGARQKNEVYVQQADPKNVNVWDRAAEFRTKL